ncbi:MAG: DUF1127 domain-containing protein [Alphaproteobacteria bacterium]|nr:DUF1127 domain-containing protein [Alphaproteobacteria bacterium]
MAVTMFDAGRTEFTTKDLIARAAFVVVSTFYQTVDAVRAAQARRETERQLGRLPDALLRDIGLERADITRTVSELDLIGR